MPIAVLTMVHIFQTPLPEWLRSAHFKAALTADLEATTAALSDAKHKLVESLATKSSGLEGLCQVS